VSRVRWTRWRRAAQALSALLWLALPVLAEPRLTGTPAALRAGPVELVEPSAALAAALAARALPLALALAALPLLALAVALGPVACSWLCPYGLVSEGIDALRARAGRPAPIPAASHRARLASLAALLALSAMAGAPIAALLLPPRALAALPLEAWSARVVPWVSAGILLALLALDALGPRRLVCRALCPAGALAALLRSPFTWGPRFSRAECRCPGRPPCVEACPWGLEPRAERAPAGCSSCMACVDECPSSALVALRRSR
jgi:ferredoxin-type protein NapH